MSLDRMRKSLKSLLGIQSNPQNEQSSQVSRQTQPDQVLYKSDQIFKNKFVIIQKKEVKLNPYKYALDRLKEYNLTMLRGNDLLKCPIISYKFNKEEKRIHENIATKPRWKKEESSQEIINIKPEDDRKSFFFHASYIKDENRQPSQSKQTAKKSQRYSDNHSEYNFEKEKQTVENISKSNKQNVQQEDNQSESESIIIDQKSKSKFRKLKPPPHFESQDVILNKDQNNISNKNVIQNVDDTQTSKQPTVQKKDVQEKLPETQISQQFQITPITECQKTEIVENKQQQVIEPQVEQKIIPQISDQLQNIPDVNPFTQNVQNLVFNPPWLDNSIQQQNQVTFNLFQQPMIQQQPQIPQPIMQPLQFQNPIQQQSQNLFPFQNQQTPNVFPNQNVFNQQPNLFQNNQQPQQNFNLFNQTNQFQQQPLFQQQQTQQSLFQQQPQSESLFQQQPSSQTLFQQQPMQQSLFQQQPSTQSVFQQQSSNNLFTSQPQNQLFQQPNQQTSNLFGNNDQRQTGGDLFSAQTVQNTPNLFQQNQVQNQESLFSLNPQSQSNNTGQQRTYSHSDRYKKNLSRYTTERIE